MKLKIYQEHSHKKSVTKLCQEIISKKYDVYLFGTNEWAEDVMNFIDVKGVINEFTDEKYFNGKIIINQLELISKESSIVISCILGRPWTVKQKLDASSLRNIDYFSFWRFSGISLIDERNWKLFQNNFDLEKYSSIYENLHDVESRNTLENIINFRLTQDLANMKFYADRQFYQYFEPFLNLENETFIDIGGFDGFTSELFVKLNPNFSGIKFFEPNEDNMLLAKNKLEKYSDKVNFFSLGVGLKKEVLKFSQSGSSSGISLDGEIAINIDSLDNLFSDFYTVNNEKLYIKMDIEGWELNALKGAEKLIKTSKPKLAICVYHKYNDIIDLYNYIKTLNADYKVFLRHYTEGVDETVMYFIP